MRNFMSPAFEKDLQPLWSSTSSVTSRWSPASLTAGPYWKSFESLRTAGSPSLDAIQAGTVATVQGKSGTFRIMRDQDFQKLIGVASEVHRIKSGLTVVIQAARIFAQHKDRATEELLISSISMLGSSPVLPEAHGHGELRLTDEERAIPFDPDDDFDLDSSSVPEVKF